MIVNTWTQSTISPNTIVNVWFYSFFYFNQILITNICISVFNSFIASIIEICFNNLGKGGLIQFKFFSIFFCLFVYFTYFALIIICWSIWVFQIHQIHVIQVILQFQKSEIWIPSSHFEDIFLSIPNCSIIQKKCDIVTDAINI